MPSFRWCHWTSAALGLIVSGCQPPDGSVAQDPLEGQRVWELRVPGWRIYQAKPVPRTFFERGQVTRIPTG